MWLCVCVVVCGCVCVEACEGKEMGGWYFGVSGAGVVCVLLGLWY